MTNDTPAKPTRPSARKMAAAARRSAVGKKTGQTAKVPVERITSKADLIRKVAGIIRAKGQRPRPSEIVKILQEEGVAVAPAQVSATLKAAGYRPLRRRRQGGRALGGPMKSTGGASKRSHISLDDLLAAKSVSGAFGGTARAIAALQALRRLER